MAVEPPSGFVERRLRQSSAPLLEERRERVERQVAVINQPLVVLLDHEARRGWISEAVCRGRCRRALLVLQTRGRAVARNLRPSGGALADEGFDFGDGTVFGRLLGDHRGDRAGPLSVAGVGEDLA